MDGALDLLEGLMPCGGHMIPLGPPVEKRRSKKLDADGWSLQACGAGFSSKVSNENHGTQAIQPYFWAF